MCKLPIFRDRLNQLLCESGGKIVSFASLIGTSRQSLGYYLNGERLPDAQMIGQICERCKVSADWLLGLSDVKQISPDIQAINAYIGLSEAAIEALRTRKEEDPTGDSMTALNKALSSPSFLAILSALLSVRSEEHGYFEGTCSPENGFYNVRMSPDSYAATLGIRLLYTLEKIRTGKSSTAESYPPYERELSETIEALRAEGRLIEKGDADNGKPTKSR